MQIFPAVARAPYVQFSMQSAGVCRSIFRLTLMYGRAIITHLTTAGTFDVVPAVLVLAGQGVSDGAKECS